ncbi:MAG: twin-arginine translocase subunit TatC [Verrucomicrobiota bacterium]|jgi:sec-independent protein translocase protein TatC
MADSPQEPEVDAEDDGGGPVKSFLEHLEDFRWLLIKCVATLALTMLVCLVGANYVIGLVKWPLTQAKARYPGTNQIVSVSFGTNHLGNYPLTPEEQLLLGTGSNRFATVRIEPVRVGTNQVLGWTVPDDPAAIASMQRMHIDLVNLTPAGGFFVAFQVAFYGGMLLAAPCMLYFIADFVFPALRFKERKYIYRAIFIGGGLFILGVAFCYFILMPVALSASQLYSQWLGLGALQWRAEEYISFVCKFMLGMGLGFELPVVILTLVKIDILSYSTLRKMWRYMIVICLVLGAFLTTPEVITQILMAGPLYLLYEVTVWIAWYWEQPDRAKARRALFLLVLVILALAGLTWAGWHYGSPWRPLRWR